MKYCIEKCENIIGLDFMSIMSIDGEYCVIPYHMDDDGIGFASTDKFDELMKSLSDKEKSEFLTLMTRMSFDELSEVLALGSYLLITSKIKEIGLENAVDYGISYINSMVDKYFKNSDLSSQILEEFKNQTIENIDKKYC